VGLYHSWSEVWSLAGASKAPFKGRAFTEFMKARQYFQETFPLFLQTEVSRNVARHPTNIHDKSRPPARHWRHERHRSPSSSNPSSRPERQKIRGFWRNSARMPYVADLSGLRTVEQPTPPRPSGPTEKAEATCPRLSIGKNTTNRGLGASRPHPGGNMVL